MPMLFNGVMRPAGVQDLLDALGEFAGVYEPSRRFDCIVWDLMGWNLRDPQQADEWPQWVRGEQVITQAVPEFSLDLRHTLDLVALQGADPIEFLHEVIEGITADDELTGMDFVRTLPVAAATLFVMRNCIH